MANLYSYEIGTTAGNMVNVETLANGTMPAPKATWRPYTELRTLGNLDVRGVGYPVVTWTWGILTRAQRDALRTYCTGASAAVYIKTQGIDNSDAYLTVTAFMVWPEEEQRDATRRKEFSIEFRKPVSV